MIYYFYTKKGIKKLNEIDPKTSYSRCLHIPLWEWFLLPELTIKDVNDHVAEFLNHLEKTKNEKNYFYKHDDVYKNFIRFEEFMKKFIIGRKIFMVLMLILLSILFNYLIL